MARNPEYEESAAELFARHVPEICAELCEGVRGARHSHPALIRDVQSAAFCAARSATFRRLVSALPEPSNG